MTALLAERLRRAGSLTSGGIGPGCHDDSFWDRRMPAGLAFLQAHLTAGTAVG